MYPNFQGPIKYVSITYYNSNEGILSRFYRQSFQTDLSSLFSDKFVQNTFSFVFGQVKTSLDVVLAELKWNNELVEMKQLNQIILKFMSPTVRVVEITR